MADSNKCKWISFGVMSVAVILLLIFLYRLDTRKCPQEGDLMVKSNGECYRRGTKGPCLNNMVFVEDEPRSAFGSCSCPYMEFNRTILHHNDVCYFVFTQAFCSEGHMLNATTKGEPVCVMNPCLQHSRNGFEPEKSANDDGEVDMKSSDQFDQGTHNMHGHRAEIEQMGLEWVPIKGGRCATLNKWTEGCPEGSVVRFHRNYIYPSCFEPPPKSHKLGQSLGAIGVGYTSCPVGSHRSISGKCQPVFDFDFEERQEDSANRQQRK